MVFFLMFRVQNYKIIINKQLIIKIFFSITNPIYQTGRSYKKSTSKGNVSLFNFAKGASHTGSVSHTGKNFAKV